MHDLERQVEEFRSLFLTSQNIEKRRLSVRVLHSRPFGRRQLTRCPRAGPSAPSRLARQDDALVFAIRLRLDPPRAPP